MADFKLLQSEIADDPLARGYAGMSDQATAGSLNAADRPVERETLAGAEIFNAIDPAEFSALTAGQKQLVRDVFGLGDTIDVQPGTNTRQVLLNAFGAGTTTRANLVGVAQKTISRAEEIGWPVRPVTAEHVARAR